MYAYNGGGEGEHAWKPSYEGLEQRVKTLEEKAIEHKRSETALRESEEKFRAVLTDIPALICRFLPDGTLTFVSSSYCSYFNKQSEELIGQNFFQFITEKDKEKVGSIKLKSVKKMLLSELQSIAEEYGIDTMKRTDSYDTNKHGTSISLLRKAIESQLVLLTEPDLRQLLIAINRKISSCFI